MKPDDMERELERAWRIITDHAIDGDDELASILKKTFWLLVTRDPLQLADRAPRGFVSWQCYLPLMHAALTASSVNAAPVLQMIK